MFLYSLRKNVGKEFEWFFNRAEEMSKKTKLKLKIPRTCKKKTLRNNILADTVINYYRWTVFVPFLDSLLQQFNVRFEDYS